MSIDPLAVDIFVGDLNGEPNIPALFAAGRPWCALNLKASEGLYYPNNNSVDPKYRDTWFAAYWALCKWLGRARLGDDFFMLEYHYARIDQDPVAQAKFNISVVKRAGGFYRGCLPPMVDVEDAENPVNPGAAVIEKWIKSFGDEIYAELGVRPILYGNNYLHENHVNFANCGCVALEVARYASTLPPETYTDIGCPLSSLLGWQYIGTEKPTPVPAGYPVYSPLSSTHTEDITAMVMNDAKGFEASLQWMRDHCIPAGKL